MAFLSDTSLFCKAFLAIKDLMRSR
uniref:Uncharacterized protein n=1 Tax=Arundo donax TaxID=35708 RepID=A0A0A9AW20_ARUDO